jgi:CRISPR-associated protein Csd2
MDHRYDFVYLFEVKDGNPNGDPDAGNLPRLDAETGQGLVTDVCIKRKIRNYVGVTKGENPPFEIYIKEKAVLNKQHERAYTASNLKSESKKMPKKIEDAQKVTQWMCQNFFDIRTFGAVMTTEVNSGQVRGPLQFTFARSLDPIFSSEHSITRCAVTTEKEAENQQGDNRTMGRKFTVPYGLYRMHGFINANLAAQTGFNANGEDLDLLWSALVNMFDHDRAAARGLMSPQALIVFEHESALGNAPAHKLFDRVKVERKNKNEDAVPPRSYSDYVVTVDDSNLPAGIKVEQKI